MIGVVVFKEGTPLGRAITGVLSHIEPVEVRGLGRAYRYDSSHRSLYFIPLKESFHFNGKRYEERITSSLGRPSFIISLSPLTEGNEPLLHATGNLTNTNPLSHPSFQPRSVSPVDADLLGTLFIALYRLNLNPHVAAVHDPPSDLTVPHISVKLGVEHAEDVVLSIIASFRRKKIFVPYVTVSRSFLADYFTGEILRRRVAAYHVPYYWVHHLDGVMYNQMAEKGRVRGILVERGLVLPGELPHKEV